PMPQRVLGLADCGGRALGSAWEVEGVFSSCPPPRHLEAQKNASWASLRARRQFLFPVPRPLLQNVLRICELPHIEAAKNRQTPDRKVGGGIRMKMLAWIIGVVVAIGLVWSVAAMSNSVPVVDDSHSAAISQPAK